MKCGTTALARYLARHPDIHVAPKKEVHFFDRRFNEGIAWYARHFESAGPDCAAVGEATAHYLYDPDAPARIASTLPNVRLIALLRNPADRAYSQYWHARTRGHERLTFEAALEQEAARLKSPRAMDRWRFSYADRGHYINHLSRYDRVFRAEQVHIIISEDMRASAAKVVAAACQFLGVDPGRLPGDALRPVNEFVRFRYPRVRRLADFLPAPANSIVNRMNMTGGRYPPMAPATRARLLDLFKSSNAALSARLGRDLSAWGS
jgi:hypothetical protein